MNREAVGVKIPLDRMPDIRNVLSHGLNNKMFREIFSTVARVDCLPTGRMLAIFVISRTSKSSVIAACALRSTRTWYEVCNC